MQMYKSCIYCGRKVLVEEGTYRRPVVCEWCEEELEEEDDA